MDEGFSLREYVSRMRSIDVVKCWPLDDNISDQQTIKSLLPPITIKKFTWWSTFLFEQNDDGKVQITIQEEEEDKSKPFKGKGKAPKKRSIVELFAVAPQVDKPGDDADEDEEEGQGGVSKTSGEEINWGVKRKRDSKKKCKEKEILLRELRKKPMKNKKKNLDKVMDPSSVSNKCRGRQNQDKAARNPSYDSENEIFGRSIHKRKLCPQYSHADNISMKSTDLKLMEENKNHSREKESSIDQQPQCISQETVHANSHKAKADEHLNLFKNERKKLSLSVEWSKLQKHCGWGTKGVIGNDLSGVETIGNEDLGNPDLRSPPVCFKDYMGTYDELSVSNMFNSEERANGMGQSSIESTGINHAHPFHCGPFPYLAPQKSLQTLFSMPTICGERIINGLDKEFIGLPLNSHGGLVTLNSSSNADVNQAMRSKDHLYNIPHERSSLLENVLPIGFNNQSEVWRSDCMTFSKDHSNNPFLVEPYVDENPSFVIPSRSDITNHSKKIDLDLDLHRKGDPSFHSDESSGKEAKKGEKIQSTMRLMGKEFLVGGRSFHGFDQETIWKDKHIIDELPYGNRSFDNVVIHDYNQQPLGRLEETFSRPSEFAMDPRFESRHMSSHFDCQATMMQQDGLPARKLHEDWNLYPKVPLGAFGADTMATASYQVAHPYVSTNSVEVENQRNKPHGKRSVIRFPFMHPDLGGHVGSSPSCSSSMNRSDFFGNGLEMGNYQPWLNHHPSLADETNHQWTESSVSFRPQAFRTNDIFSSGSGSTFPRPAAPIFPTQLIQHVIVPCDPGFAPEIKRYGDQKNTSRIMSNVGIRGCKHGKKSRRQRSSAPNVPSMTFKLPTFGVLEGPQHVNAEPSTYDAQSGLIKPLTEAVSEVRLLEPENLKNICRF